MDDCRMQKKLEGCPSVAWLGFEHELLTEDGTQLKPQYALDGIHMHPDYLTLLEAALGVDVLDVDA